MLDRLFEVDWDKLTHAYGDAADVPELIEDILSSEREVFENAVHELFGNIWHQGTVYEATPKALPFLIFIYENKEVLDRDHLLSLLASIAAGSGYHQVHSAVKITNPFTGKTLEPPPNLDELLQKENDIVREVQILCTPLLDKFISELGNDSPHVRELIATALAKYPEIKYKSLPALESALMKENKNCSD